jgi:hypothetical protein
MFWQTIEKVPAVKKPKKNNSAVVVPMPHNGLDYGYNKFP